MKNIIISILLMLLMGCSEVTLPLEEAVAVSECLECFGDYHIDENGHCICD